MEVIIKNRPSLLIAIAYWLAIPLDLSGLTVSASGFD